MKIVINKCYGGFELSEAAYERLIELGVPVRKYIEQVKGEDGRYKPEPANEGEIIFDRSLSPEGLFGGMKRSAFFGRYWDTWTRDKRTHPLVVQVVEELGAKASTSLSKLRVVDVPADLDWELDEYDGIETVRERSRSWG